MNYTRSFFFYFLPFYHAGVRVHEQFSDKLGINYWSSTAQINRSPPTVTRTSFSDTSFSPRNP